MTATRDNPETWWAPHWFTKKLAPYKVVRETPQKIFIDGYYQHDSGRVRSKYKTGFYRTFEAAHQAQITRLHREIANAKTTINAARAELDELKTMERPEVPWEQEEQHD